MADLSDYARSQGRRRGGGGGGARRYDPIPPTRTPYRSVGGYRQPLPEPEPEPDRLPWAGTRPLTPPEENPPPRQPRPFGARSKEGARSSADFTRVGDFTPGPPVDRNSPRAQVRDPLLSGSPWADRVNAGLGEGMTPEMQARLQALRQAMINSARSGA